MAILGSFKSPTTGNAVTWDETGKQTDTGIPNDYYLDPGKNPRMTQSPNSWGGGSAGGTTSTIPSWMPDRVGSVDVRTPAAPVTGFEAGTTYGQYQDMYKNGKVFGQASGTNPALMTPEQYAAQQTKFAADKATYGQAQQGIWGGVDGNFHADTYNVRDQQLAAGAAKTAAAPGLSPNAPNSGIVNGTTASGQNYFISPTTGNMVTWDATGKQTDTGQKPPGSAPAVTGALTQAYQPVGGSLYQPGQTTGAMPQQSQSFNWGAPPAQSFNTPVLDSLYNAQQQRMTTPAPSFNFQAKLGETPPAQPGALTQAITG